MTTVVTEQFTAERAEGNGRRPPQGLQHRCLSGHISSSSGRDSIQNLEVY